MEYDESSDSFHVRAAFGSSPDLLEQLRAITIDRESTLVGRTATRPPAAGGSRPGAGRARPASGHPVPRRLALGARGSDAARRQDGGRAGDPAPGHGHFPARRDRAARDLRQPVGAGHRQRTPVPGAGDQDQRARDRQPPQVGVPGQHVPRTADPVERGDRLLRGAAGSHVRRDQRAPGRVPARHLELGQAPARAAQRDPGPVEGRSGPDGARAKHVQRRQRPGVHPGDGPRAGDSARHHRHGARSPTTSGRSTPTSCDSSRWSSTCSPTPSSSPPTAAAFPSAPTARGPSSWSP